MHIKRYYTRLTYIYINQTQHNNKTETLSHIQFKRKSYISVITSRTVSVINLPHPTPPIHTQCRRRDSRDICDMYREDEGVVCTGAGSRFRSLGFMFARRWMPTRVSDAASYMFAPDSVVHMYVFNTHLKIYPPEYYMKSYGDSKNSQSAPFKKKKKKRAASSHIGVCLWKAEGVLVAGLTHHGYENGLSV